MNRHHRRAAEAQARKQASNEHQDDQQRLIDETIRDQNELVAGCEWVSEMDPEDGRFALISMRIPTTIPKEDLVGAAASNRLGEFLAAYVRAMHLAAAEMSKRRAVTTKELVDSTGSKLIT